MRREPINSEKESLAARQDIPERSTKRTRIGGRSKSDDADHTKEVGLAAQLSGGESAPASLLQQTEMTAAPASTDSAPVAYKELEDKGQSVVTTGTAGDGTDDGEPAPKVETDAALLSVQDADSQEAKNRNADSDRRVAQMTSEDEELYYKLFPEDRESERHEAVSALEVTGQKAFHIRVPVSGGKRLCLTEANHGGRIHAEPCRSKSQRQKWYWKGSRLKNLFSSKRCLGFAHEQHHIGSQMESLAQQTKAQAELDQAQGHHLSMAFQCSDQEAPLAWALDEHGRLMNSANNECMAINEKADNEVVVLPCHL